LLSWHVAFTEPFKGEIAEREIAGAGFGVFNPKVKTIKTFQKRKPVESIRPFVPGYIFARFDTDDYGWQRIAKMRGIKDFMYAGPEKPARVRDDALLPLMSMCNDGFVIEEKADRFLFSLGSVAKAKSGPFEGIVGKVIRSSYERVQIMIEIFGRPTPVVGAAVDFEPVRA
jgi:transcription antitermination factor NusG